MFSLAGFGGRLHAGHFGYGLEGQSMLSLFPPWETASPGITGIGESICALEVFGVWRYDGVDLELRYETLSVYVTDLHPWRGALFAGTSDGWKEDVGTSALLMSVDGNAFETMCEFDEIAIWALEELNDRLYVGTWQFGSGGAVYEVVPSPS